MNRRLPQKIDAKIRRPAMASRRLLMCCVGFGAASLMVGTLAIADKGVGSGELGSGAAYSGVPSDDNDHAGMAFIRGGAVGMGSERQRPGGRFTPGGGVGGVSIRRREGRTRRRGRLVERLRCGREADRE